MNQFEERDTCRVCDGTLWNVLDLGNPYLNNFLAVKDENALRVPLVLARCGKCDLVQLRHTAKPDSMYRVFWYKSGITETMKLGLRSVVADAMRYHNSGTWIDIGANDGFLLGCVPQFHRVGYEPALNLTADLAHNCDEVISDYFHARPYHDADVITSIAMFYDLDDPVSFAQEIVKSLSAQGVWINQLSHTHSMYDAVAFDNICHEHLCYYTLKTLKSVYDKVGLRIIDVSFNNINGGSMRVIACKESAAWKASDSVEIVDSEVPLDHVKFLSRVLSWKDRMQRVLERVEKPIYVYGASTKGNTLLQYLKWEGFEGAAERNPEKYGLLTVGSWIPIVSEVNARERAKTFFVLPWAFKREIIHREKEFVHNGGALLFPLPFITRITHISRDLELQPTEAVEERSREL